MKHNITNIYTLSIICFILLSVSENFGQSKGIIVDSDFPGGNIKVNKIENDTIWIEPDLRDTEGYWFYWYFRVKGVEGRKIRFQFIDKPVFSRFGPAYSLNNDKTWKWYGEKSYENNGFDFQFSTKDTIAYFSMGFPYTEKNFHEYLDKIENYKNIKIDTLTFTIEGRPVEQLYITPNVMVKDRVFITARNHACEMMGNYMLEGIIDGILNERSLDYLRDFVEFRIIPFVDKDGVEDGDQGKNRLPRDHNRDYDNNSIYPEIQAIMKEVPLWSDNKLKISLDLHNPYIKGVGSDAEYIFLVGSDGKDKHNAQLKMSKLLESNNIGELKFYSSNFMKFGDAWNKGSNTSKGPSKSNWSWTIPGISLSTTIEFPYSYVSGVAVSKDNARVFGTSIAKSLQDYLLDSY